MGYHIRTIKKQQVGTIEKVLEEVEEYQDAMEQGCKIMALVELSDIYGALQLVADKHNVTMDDLKSMANITRRAFEDGSRKSSDSLCKEMREPGEVQLISDKKDYLTDQDKINDSVNHIIAEFNAYDKDLRFDMQSNTAKVSITHVPTGLTASCDYYSNMIDNRREALVYLAKLLHDFRVSKMVQEIKKRFEDRQLKSPGVAAVMKDTNYNCGCGRGNDCCIVTE